MSAIDHMVTCKSSRKVEIADAIDGVADALDGCSDCCSPVVINALKERLMQLAERIGSELRADSSEAVEEEEVEEVEEAEEEEEE